MGDAREVCVQTQQRRTAGALLGAIAAWFTLVSLGLSEQKPNVLFIFTDDQRFDTIGALGNPHIETPNLDRLARRSFVFRNAYCLGGNTGAVCIPSRNMTMSGRTWFRFNYDRKTKALVDRNTSHADPGGPTFPKSMSRAGYETYYSEKSGTANLPQIQTQFNHIQNVNMVDALATGRPARQVVDDAIAFISRSRDKSKPFFMYLGLPCPHDPRWATKRFRDLYDPALIPLPPNYRPMHPWDIGSMTIRDERLEAWPRTPDAVRRHLHDYYALISSMDHDIGRLLDTLEELSLSGETIIVFSSDQGIAIGSHGLMGKQNIYEDTLKVPLLFAGPAIPKGESEALAYLHDVFPTVAELVGAAPPGDIDGRSLVPVIRGHAEKVRDTLLLAYTDSQRSVRDAQWKLIRFPKIDRTLLFDLKNDPRETKDLSADPSKARLIEKMMTVLADQQRLYGDTLPLAADDPIPAEFIPPENQQVQYRGGLAPQASQQRTVKE